MIAEALLQNIEQHTFSVQFIASASVGIIAFITLLATIKIKSESHEREIDKIKKDVSEIFGTVNILEKNDLKSEILYKQIIDNQIEMKSDIKEIKSNITKK